MSAINRVEAMTDEEQQFEEEGDLNAGPIDEGFGEQHDDDHYSERVQKRIGKEVGKRKAIETERDVYRTELEKANSELAEFKKTAAEQRKQQLENDAKRLKEQAKTAMEDGEVDSYMDLNDELLDRRVELARVTTELEHQPKQEVEDKPAAPTQTRAAKSWLDRNSSWFSQDPDKAAKAQALESELFEEGYEYSDPRLYAELDKRLNGKRVSREQEQGSTNADYLATPGASIPSGAARSRTPSREDMQLMRRYGFDPNNPEHREEWMSSKGGA